MSIRAGEVVLSLVSIVFTQAAHCKEELPKPCMNLAFHYHDILYDGSNAHNATSAKVGAAQGFYFYDIPYASGAWIALTVVLNSTENKGTLSMAGADVPIVDTYRYFSVLGGSGDFLMARGIAVISTDQAALVVAYFCLFFNISLSDCY